MKIAIDSRSLTAGPSGTSGYLIAAVNELSTRNPSWTFDLLAHKDPNGEAVKLLSKRENIVITVKPFFAFRNVGTVWYLVKVFSILKSMKPDIFWAPGVILPPWMPKKIKTLVTVHDLIPKKYKQTMAFNTRLSNDVYFDRSIKKADILWAVSNYTKSEIEKHYPERKCKNIFVGSGVNKAIFKKMGISREEKQRFLEKLKIDEDFLLFVGTIEPRKNLQFLLSLMPDIAKMGYSLLIAGSQGWGRKGFARILNQPGYPLSKVVFCGFLTTEDLVKAFNVASLFVSTSINEGFGLPQLEAMNCGCPVVTSHNSGMIEVVEGAGETVKGWDRKDWVDAIAKVALNRDHYIRLGFQRAKQYDWSFVAADLASHLEQDARGQ